MDKSNQTVICGKIIFENLIESLRNVNLIITVEDASKQDVSSTIVTTVRADGIDFTPDQNDHKEFSLALLIEDNRCTYILNVHIDTNRDGMINAGDYINTGSHTINSDINPNHLDIIVKKVV